MAEQTALSKYPLPKGWEEKYDWQTRRFFYIDHNTKVTSWVDPRIELYKSKVQEQASKSNDESDDESGVSNSSEETRPIQSTKETYRNKAIALQKKYPQFTTEKIEQLFVRYEGKEVAVETFLNTLKATMIAEEEEARKKRQLEEKRLHEEEIRKEVMRFEEEERKKAIHNLHMMKEEMKKKAEEEVKKKSEEAKKKVELETKKKAEDEAKRKAEEESKKKSELEAKQKADEEIKRKLEEARIKSESEIENSTLEKVVSDRQTYKQEGREKILEQKQVHKSAFYVGPNKSIAHGPDGNIRVGHKSDLITKSTDLAKGPNPDNWKGPNNSLGIAGRS